MKLNEKELKQFKRWVKALRSGEYSQATGNLQKDNSYCCLGVACIVLIPESELKRNPNNKQLIGSLPTGDVQPNSPKWLQKINSDYNVKNGIKLWELNDMEEYTFDMIADCLELEYIHFDN